MKILTNQNIILVNFLKRYKTFQVSWYTTLSSQEPQQNTKFTLKQKYLEYVSNGTLREDPFQLGIINKLNDFYLKVDNKIESNPVNKKRLFFPKLFKNKSSEKTVHTKGVYLYGGVGCGKTMLMDLTYSLIDNRKKKLRMHFNKFMLDVHKRIHIIKENSDSSDPIPVVAQELVNEVNVLFFDEFQVTDIVDAMLMSRLFTALFERGLIMFSTSNRPPDDLYKNGLQRESFIPFIDILKIYCDIICLDSNVDYRKLAFPSNGKLYYNSDSESVIFERFVEDLIRKEIEDNSSSSISKQELTINVLGRDIHLNDVYNKILVTDFSFMCEEARGSIDYLKFCEIFDVIVLRNVPIIDLRNANTLRRFITFIDTLYDNRVKLVCSGKANDAQSLFKTSETNVNEIANSDRQMMSDLINSKVINTSKQNSLKSTPSLFTLEEELFAIDRTISRLIEMQSQAYWDECDAASKKRANSLK